MLQRERKRRVEAAEAFRSGGREEQAEAEERELAVLEEFMPEPLSEEELEEIVDDAIAEVGATSMRDFGRVMADVMPQVVGPRRRLGREPARPREARLSELEELSEAPARLTRACRVCGVCERRPGRRSAYTEALCSKCSPSRTTSPPSWRLSATACSTRCATGFAARSGCAATA